MPLEINSFWIYNLNENYFCVVNMLFSDKFVSATTRFNTIKNPVSAPLFRKNFCLNKLPNKFEVTIAGLGIYELFINGKRVTKGYLSPYRANPTHFIYYDNYDLTDKLNVGENVIGVTLGNGFINSTVPTWDFDKAPWVSAPKFAISVEADNVLLFDATQFKCDDSEIIFDDFHRGEHIDANLVKAGWNDIGFCDDNFKPVILVVSPIGEKVLTPIQPILPYSYRKPVKVIKTENSFIYDFGVDSAGTYNLKIKGEKGKTIKLQCGEIILNGHVDDEKISCVSAYKKDYVQCDWLTLSGNLDEFEPRFSYKGMRFIEIFNLTDDEANSLDLTYIELSTLKEVNGEFYCDNQVINILQEMILRSDRSNFYHFPTDCPQREKNGWTGDAALSAEQFLLNFNCASPLKEWIKNICKAQNEQGTLPGIVPTNDWGFAWGNGPAWDNVLFELPYRIYVYTGDTEIIEYGKPYMMKYLKYMDGNRDERGLLHYGLHDWLPINKDIPLEYSDTATCKAICDNAVGCFKAIGYTEGEEYAKRLGEEIKDAFRKHLAWEGKTVWCESQTAQSMAIHYNIVDKKDIEHSVSRLKDFVFKSSNHMDIGVLGSRTLFRALGDNGFCDLAVKLITQDSYPSYYTHIKVGSTTLLEKWPLFDDMTLDNLTRIPEGIASANHHFWGDISAFFYRNLAGIKINEPFTVDFKPDFAKTVGYVRAYFKFKTGKFMVEYKRDNDKILATVTVPDGVKANLIKPDGYKILSPNSLTTGVNTIVYVKE